MLKKSWVRGLAALVALGSAACGSAPHTEQTSKDTKAIDGYHDFALWNNATGEVATWLLYGPEVVGALPLDARCGPSDGCSDTWYPYATDGNKVLWFDQFGSGDLVWWSADDSGHVTSSAALSLNCPPPGCSYVWKPVGVLHVAEQEGVLWYNEETHDQVIWWLWDDEVTVTATPLLSEKCGALEGCGSLTSPAFPWFTADFDGDGNSDILWWNQDSGQLTAWLLADTDGTVKGKQTLSWTVPPGSGWTLVGAGDADGDGFADVLWQKYPEGTMSNWLLDGNGTVIGGWNLSWTCDKNCATAGWVPRGYFDF